MATKINHLLQSFVRSNEPIGMPGAWQPMADVYQKGNEWLLKIELAGVSIEELSINADNKRLILKGVRKDRFSGQHVAHSMEIAYNYFERVFEFSGSIEGSVETDYKDGMLYISLRTG